MVFTTLKTGRAGQHCSPYLAVGGRHFGGVEDLALVHNVKAHRVRRGTTLTGTVTGTGNGAGTGTGSPFTPRTSWLAVYIIHVVQQPQLYQIKADISHTYCMMFTT